MSDEGYELLEHTADIRVHAFGPSVECVFVQAAHGMAEVLLSGAGGLEIDPEGEEQIRITAPDRESLLVDWLAEILYRSSVHRRIYTRFHFSLFTETALEGAAGWHSADLEEEIKAVTRHGLVISCERDDGLWETTVTFDL